MNINYTQKTRYLPGIKMKTNQEKIYRFIAVYNVHLPGHLGHVELH